MSEVDFTNLYQFLPIDPTDSFAVNESLRQIADSLEILSQQSRLTSGVAGQPFIPDQAIEKFGTNTDIDNGSVPEDVASVGGVLTPPGSANTVSFVSDSANDTAAGSGARELTVIGVNGDNDEVTETIATNGTTTVNLSTPMKWINRAFVSDGAVNVGTITFTINSNTVVTIQAGVANTQSTALVVPNAIVAGQKAYLTKIEIEVGRNANAYATVLLKVTEPGGVERVRKNYIVNAGGPINDVLVPFHLPAGTFLRLQVTTVSGNNMQVSGDLEILWLTPPA